MPTTSKGRSAMRMVRPTIAAISRERRLPELMTQNDHRARTGCRRICGKNWPPVQRADLQHREIIPRNRQPVRVARLDPRHDRGKPNRLAEDRHLRAQVLILLPRQPVSRPVLGLPSEPIQAVRILHRERMQHVSVEQRKERGVQP